MAEDKKANAIMEFLYRPEMVEEVGRHFDEVVAKIEANGFHILTPPKPKICLECEFRRHCLANDVLTRFASLTATAEG